MKYNLNNKLNAAKNVILNASVSELEMALHLQLNGIEDKDAIAEANQPMVFIGEIDWSEQDFLTEFEQEYFRMEYVPSVGWTRKQVRRANITKDKAKAGTRAKKGYSHDERMYLAGEKASKLRANSIREANAIINDGTIDTEATVQNGVTTLWTLYGEQVCDKTDRLYNYSFYHYNDWYTIDRIGEVKSEALSIWLWAKEMEKGFYESIDSIYPEMGMSYSNEVVKTFMSEVYRNIQVSFDMAVGHIRVCVKDRIQNEIDRLEDELNAINLRRDTMGF